MYLFETVLNYSYCTFQDLARSKEVTPEEASRLIAAKMAEKESHGRNWYRINATRMMGGGKRLVPKVMSVFQGVSIRNQVTTLSLCELSNSLYDHDGGDIGRRVTYNILPLDSIPQLGTEVNSHSY